MWGLVVLSRLFFPPLVPCVVALSCVYVSFYCFFPPQPYFYSSISSVCLSKTGTKPELINQCGLELPRQAFYIPPLCLSISLALSAGHPLFTFLSFCSLLFSRFFLPCISLSPSHPEISAYTALSLQSSFLFNISLL